MQYFNLHTHSYSGQDNIVELVNQYPAEFDDGIPACSIGIHPWHINPDRLEQDLAIMEDKLKGPNCLAVGECGLDKRIDTPIETQLPVFERQLLLAERHNKPVIIHCVAAFQEVIETKERLGLSVPVIIHGFSKSLQLAKSLTDHGFYLSFGKYLLRNPELGPVFGAMPNDRFFLETDTAEEDIEAVYTIAAKYKAIGQQQLSDIIKTNFNFVFQK